MADGSRRSLEEAFHYRLLAAVTEVRQHTRAGIKRTLERIQNVGGLQTAKERLAFKDDSALARILNRPDEYFWAARRVGRMDMSIEAIVLEPGWSDLFTSAEIDIAASRLKEQGFNPPLELQGIPETRELALRDPAPFTELSFRKEKNAFRLLQEGKRAACDLAAEQSVQLRAQERPKVSKRIRDHLNDCINCRKLYPDLIAAYERFDQEALKVLRDLLANFQKSLLLGDDELKRFMPTEPEDYRNSEEYDADLDAQLESYIRPRCAWRAVRLGYHVGRFMLAFSSTHDRRTDLWLSWRNGEIRGPVSDFIQSMDRDLFVLGLAALNLLCVHYWPKAEEDILWIPTDGDLKSIPGLVQADEVSDLDQWEEILGNRPDDLNLMGVLYLAGRTAMAEVHGSEREGIEPAAESSFKTQLDRIEALAQSNQTSLDDIRTKQDAEIYQLERMVAYMSNNDRHASEQSLMAELRGVYQKLLPQVRCLLLAAEQIYRTRDFAAPGELIHAFATAFEVQMRSSLLPTLLAYLKSTGTPTLHPLKEWSTDQNKPVYSGKLKAERLSLGEMGWLISHPEPRIAECFDLLRLNIADVSGAVAAVRQYRNDAGHGRSIDIVTADSIRRNWLQWGGKEGGIFAVLFKGE